MTLNQTAFKPKPARWVKCKHCGEQYHKRTMEQTACSIPCAIKAAQLHRSKQDKAQAAQIKKAAKESRLQLKARKMAVQPRKWWLKRAESAVNAYVRLRDADKPCISCGTPGPALWQAGHYLSVGACPELRFDTSNIHRQCVHCNMHKAGNVSLYRIELVKRIGVAAVEALEGPHPPLKLSIDDLAQLHDDYRSMYKRLNRV